MIDDQVTEGSRSLRKDPNLLGRRRAPRRTASAGATSEGVPPTLQQGESGVGRGASALPKESFNSGCNRLLGLPQQRCFHAIPWWKLRPCHAGKNPPSLNDHSYVSNFLILKTAQIHPSPLCSPISWLHLLLNFYLLISCYVKTSEPAGSILKNLKTPPKHQDGLKFSLCKRYSLPYSIQFA